MPSPPPSPLLPPGDPSATTDRRIVVCETHGLRYDAAQYDGCARCRKQAAAILAAGVADPSEGIGRSLAVTAVLLVLLSLGLYSVHKATIAEGQHLFDAVTGDSTAPLPGDDLL